MTLVCAARAPPVPCCVHPGAVPGAVRCAAGGPEGEREEVRVRFICVFVSHRDTQPAAATPVATTRHTALGTDWHTPAAARHPGFFYSFRVVSS